jgi:hypothetical protein
LEKQKQETPNILRDTREYSLFVASGSLFYNNGLPQPLSPSDTFFRSVITIKASDSNSGVILVGARTGVTFVLAKSESVQIFDSTLDSVFVIVQNSGDSVMFLTGSHWLALERWNYLKMAERRRKQEREKNEINLKNMLDGDK